MFTWLLTTAAAFLTQGLTERRNAFKTLVTHLTVSDDTTAFSAAHTGINPGAAATSTHVETVSEADVDGITVDFSCTVVGASEFTGKVINCIGLSKGLGVRSATGSGGTHTGGAIVGTDTISRSLRPAGLGIGVASGDTYTLTVRDVEEDNSA